MADYKLIPLGGKRGAGLFVKVSPEDYELVSQFSWCLNSDGYARTYVPDQSKRRRQREIKMHRLINDTPSGFQTDHINRDRLDNRRENLRTCTNSQNQMNTAIKGAVPYRGVSFNKRKVTKPWIARVTRDGVIHNLGYFDSPEEAAKVYDRVAKKLLGEFANLNFPTQLAS
jgi:hypothetical protein